MVIPTFNEADNVTELVARINDALVQRDAEILFVDDSTDATPSIIEASVAKSALPVHMIHREVDTGGLSGAVVSGLAASNSRWVVVMDGDLQHPPELIPTLIDAGESSGADVVVASRHIAGGSSGGLDGPVRALVSSAAKVLAIAMFPVRLRKCTDPMSGFFAVRKQSIDVAALHPQGFKILLEILARTACNVVEVPLVFGTRKSGESKATVGQGMRYIRQLAALRFGKLAAFGVIGTIGAIANLAIMAVLQAFGMWYVTSAIIAGVVTIIGNFILQERFVFADLRNEGRSLRERFVRSFTFNAAETIVRTALMWVIVETTSIHSILVQAVLLALGFLIRFIYHSLVVYKPHSVDQSVSESGHVREPAPR